MMLRIATRKSVLALWQAEHVAEQLRALPQVEAVEMMPLSTRGDEILDRSLQKIGGKGLFIKELEVALAEGRADIAVHSMKDVPAEMPDGFRIGAILKRANPFDALVAAPGTTLESLREGARIGSSSLRRQAQLKALRPDFEIEPLRGNVQTRLAKLDSGDFDAIMLACAGLERLGLGDRISQQLDASLMLPAAAQGVIGIEYYEGREGREDLAAVLQELDDLDTFVTTEAERSVARRLEATCQSPVASYATLDDTTLTLTALVAAADGSEVLKEQISGARAECTALGMTLADRLLSLGAERLLGPAAA